MLHAAMARVTRLALYETSGAKVASCNISSKEKHNSGGSGGGDTSRKISLEPLRGANLGVAHAGRFQILTGTIQKRICRQNFDE